MSLSTDKTLYLQVRLCPVDMDKLKALAASKNITVSEWVRRAIQNGKS